MAKLLIDNNISVLVKSVFKNDFPESKHVYELGLAAASDQEIWNLAFKEYDAIISKDKDFFYKSVLVGSPPKFIWITVGNCSNQQLVFLVRRNISEIKKFLDSEQDILSLR